MAHTAGVGFLVVGGDAVFFQQGAGAGGQGVHPVRLQLAVGAGDDAMAAARKKAGHQMPVFVGADGQLHLVAVAVGGGGAQHLVHGHVQLGQALKSIPHKLRFGGALGRIADMPQAAAAAGAGYGTILFDAAGAGGQQLFQFAEGIAFHGLDDAHFGHIAGGGGCDKNGLAVMMGHAAAVVGKGFNGEGQDLIFLKGHGCSLHFALYCWACWAAFCSASRAVRYLLGGTFFTFLKTREK